MPSRRAGGSIHRPVVWVTGASRGIGREIAAKFASMGCEVCMSGRDRRALSAAAREIGTTGGRAYPYPCDITRRGAILAAARRIRRERGDVDVLVNNAGITAFKSFLNTPAREFESIIVTNLLAQAEAIRAVLPGMARRREGWIFNIITTAAIKTFRDSSAYTASKAGMLALANVLREEMKSSNVKIVNIVPGPTDTEMWSRSTRRRLGNRMMRAASVAEAVLAAYQMPDDVVVDQIVVRPMMGDVE